LTWLEALSIVDHCHHGTMDEDLDQTHSLDVKTLRPLQKLRRLSYMCASDNSFVDIHEIPFVMPMLTRLDLALECRCTHHVSCLTGLKALTITSPTCIMSSWMVDVGPGSVTASLLRLTLDFPELDLDLSILPTQLTRLSILSMESCKVSSQVEEISHLIQLKKLGLRVTNYAGEDPGEPSFVVFSKLETLRISCQVPSSQNALPSSLRKLSIMELPDYHESVRLGFIPTFLTSLTFGETPIEGRYGDEEEEGTISVMLPDRAMETFIRSVVCANLPAQMKIVYVTEDLDDVMAPVTRVIVPSTAGPLFPDFHPYEL
jgi:hypothetical protein